MVFLLSGLPEPEKAYNPLAELKIRGLTHEVPAKIIAWNEH
jgi:hypothetical protein